MGADVVKVEAVQRPDGIRFSATVRPRDDAQFYEKSALFHACNLGKRGITLDLGHPDGLALAKRLVERSDVVAENFTPQVMERFGLDWDTVHALNPAAIMLRMPAFGLDGPWRSRGGFAQTMEQLTGMAWVTGYEGGPPIIPGGPVDPMVGAHAALALVAALERRDTYGGRPARRGSARRSRHRRDRRAGDPATRSTARCWIAGAPAACTAAKETTRGSRSTVRTIPWRLHERAEWCSTRTPDAARARRAAQGVAAAAMVPGYATLDDAQMRARGSSNRSTTRSSASSTTRRGPCASRRVRRRSGRGPRRRSVSTPPKCCRELGVDDDELARLEARTRDRHVTRLLTRPRSSAVSGPDGRR